MTAVFDKTSVLTGTDDGDSYSPTNLRIVVPASDLIAGIIGTACQLELRFGSLCPSTTGAISSMWFGQSGASPPNFTGDQVQVKFAGGASINGSGGAVIVSDIFTLAQPFDATKSYTCAFFIPGSPNFTSLSEGSVAGVTIYADTTTGSDTSSQTAPANQAVLLTNTDLFLEKISIPIVVPVLMGQAAF